MISFEEWLLILFPLKTELLTTPFVHPSCISAAATSRVIVVDDRERVSRGGIISPPAMVLFPSRMRHFLKQTLSYRADMTKVLGGMVPERSLERLLQLRESAFAV